jgi:hypothetical protein
MPMAEQQDGPSWKSAARGESAWKEAMEKVASRNQAARAAGKKRREEHLREREAVRQEADARRHARVVSRRRAR